MGKAKISDMLYLRGDVFTVSLGEENIVGSEQRGNRYAVIVQNDIGNKFSKTVIVALLTSRSKNTLPVHHKIFDRLEKDSIIMCEQIRTIDKVRLGRYICSLKDEDMEEVDKCLLISLGLSQPLKINA